MLSTHRVLANIPRVQPGQPVRAEHFMALRQAVHELASALHGSDRQEARLVFGKLNEDLEKYQRDKGIDRVQYDRSASAGSDPVYDSTKDTIWAADVQNQTWLEGEHHWFAHLPSSNTLIPILGLQLYIGKLDGSLSQGSSATMSIWKRNSGDTDWEDSTKDITVYDWMLASGESIAADKKCVAVGHLQSRKALVIAAQC